MSVSGNARMCMYVESIVTVFTSTKPIYASSYMSHLRTHTLNSYLVPTS